MSEAATTAKPYQDEATLRRLYHKEGMTQEEIGEKFGVSHKTISNWMKKHDIRAINEYVGLTITTGEYEQWSVKDQSIHCKVHQLLAIASGADPHVVFDDNYDVHHKNHIPWYNIEENLEVLTRAEHRSRHRRCDLQYEKCGLEKLREFGFSQYDIADFYDVSQRTISNWLNELDID